MTRRRVLVTGGAGFIGSNLVDALLERGDEVVVLDDLSTGYADNIDPRVLLVIGDVADPPAVAEAIAGCHAVFHLAAQRGVAGSVSDPLGTDHVNTSGTLTVLDAARAAGVQRVVCTSSSSVYGGAAKLPTPEDSPLLPRSPYAVSKLAGEHYARVYHELHGLATVCLRPFNVYGPRQRADSAYAAVIPLFMAALRAGEPPQVHGSGHQTRDFSYVDDVVDAHLAAGDIDPAVCSGCTYNVAGNGPVSILELLVVLGRLLGVEPQPVFVAARPGDVDCSHADLRAVAHDLGWQPKVDLEDGLRRTLHWAASQPPASSADKSGPLPSP